MANNYLINGEFVSIVSDGILNVTDKLPVGIYTIYAAPMQPLKLQRIQDMRIPDKLFGSTIENAKKIIHTFQDRTVSTGVLLAGKKGTGKTLLARTIAIMLQNDCIKPIPTIVVPFNMIGPEVAAFIDKIDTECMILFDEIDKIPGENDEEVRNNTNCLLGLFDGLSVYKRLYILTANDVDRINKQFLNRPGRIYYKLNFSGLEDSAVIEYCNEKLKNKEYIKDMQHVSTLIRDFSFDIMQALVEECNRYDISPRDACNMLNVAPDMRGEFKLSVFDKKTGKEYEMTPYGKYKYMEFDDCDNNTEVQFYDIEHGRKGIKDKTNWNSQKDMKEALKRFEVDEEYRNRMSRRSLYIMDTDFKRVEHGALVYEVNDVIVKCAPVGFTNHDRFLAF